MSGRARAATAVYGAATAYQLTGDVTAASERRAAEAIAPARASGYVTETLHSYTSLAALHVLQGRLRAAAATYAEVERLVPGQDALRSLIGSPSYYFGMGDLLREWNNLDAAGAGPRAAAHARRPRDSPKLSSILVASFREAGTEPSAR